MCLNHKRCVSLFSLILFSAYLLLFAGKMVSAQANLEDSIPVYLDTKYGRITIDLFPRLAPKHVERIKELTKSGFYDGVVFHRVIPGFMAQTGDPTGTGRGGSNLPNLPAEFSSTPFRWGSVGMARAQSFDSGNSQFFICFQDSPFLNGNYTYIGQATPRSMRVVNRLKKGDPRNNGLVTNPDKIIRMFLDQ